MKGSRDAGLAPVACEVAGPRTENIRKTGPFWRLFLPSLTLSSGSKVRILAHPPMKTGT